MRTDQIFRIYSRRVKPFVTDTEKKPFTYIGLTLFSLSFFGAFAIRPALITITELRHQIELAQEIDSQLQTKLRNISRARPIYERVEDDFPILEEALPEEKPLSNLINSLNIHASIAGVSISSLRISGGEETAFKGKILIDNALVLQISGSFASINDFVKNLEGSRRQFSVDYLQMRSLSRGQDGEGVLSATVGLKTFSLEREGINEEGGP